MKPQPSPAKAHSQIETVRLVWLAIFISVFSFLFYNRQGSVLLYGDAVAHINIARRVFDSRTPGLLQLGTVWLPLPHLLILPFIVSNKMWQSGAGGSIPSMAAYVLAVLGIFRLVRGALNVGGETQKLSISAWTAAILYAANPNLIYMQATAMGESLYLAFFIWTAVYFAEFTRGNSKALTKCGLCVAAACLTRYDGWFLAVLVIVGVLTISLRKQSNGDAPGSASLLSRGQIAKFILIAAAAPIFWLAYNAAVYRNPLEFANGPYSAKSIEQKTATVNPAKGNLFAAGSYFLKAAELNVAESSWLGRLWLALALLGAAVAAYSGRSRLALLFWAPLPFYALSIAYGSVPIFVPTWWPFAQYNVRYGLQLLPAFAVFVPMGISFLLQFATKLPQVKPSWRIWTPTATVFTILLLALSSYAAIWRADPICYREADKNMKGRVALDHQLGEWIKSLPSNSTLLMYLGEHVGALEQAGIPLRRTINEGNHRVWKYPVDPDGLWERALADPASNADYVIGFEGDPVWTAARAHHLTALVEIHTTGQPPAVIFQGRPQNHTPGLAR
ncbi:MAG TPA: hypothetical protein VGZ91_08875 [Candidatus Sulfotelmatobacter sp.]|jgi:hypothetical protein|nr:hypothetical protein [Candidatus Sulfotelmatobacter sp.]